MTITRRRFAMAATGVCLLAGIVFSIGFRARRGAEDPAIAALDDLIERLHGGRSGIAERGRNLREIALVEIDRLSKGLLAREQGSPAAQAARGHIQRRLGDVQRLIENFAEAEEIYRAAAATFEELTRGVPGVLEPRLEAARVAAHRGQALQRAGRIEEAESAFRDGLLLLERLAESESGESAAKIDEVRGRLQCQLGLLFLSSGRPEPGEKALRRGVGALDREEIDAGPELKFIRAGAHGSLGGIDLARDRLPEAERHYRDAIHLLRELVEDFPKAPEYLLHRVQTQHGLGLGYLRAGMLFEAGRVWREALPHAERLASDFPSPARHRYVLAEILSDLGGLVHRFGELAEAESLCERALPALEERVAGGSTEAHDRRRLVETLHLLVQVAADRDGLVAAIPRIEKMAQAGDAAANLRAAALLIRCMLSQEDDCLDDSVSEVLAEDYCRRVVKHLRRAVELGLEKPQDIANSETFRPLRGKGEFELFVAELRRK